MVKLFVVALLLIVGGAILGMTTDLNPALLIVAGFVCGLVAAVRGARQPYLPVDSGEASPGAATDALTLSNYRYPTPDHTVGPFTSEGGGAP